MDFELTAGERVDVDFAPKNGKWKFYKIAVQYLARLSLTYR